MNNKELKDEELDHVNGGYDELEMVWLNHTPVGVCPHGVTAEEYPVYGYCNRDDGFCLLLNLDNDDQYPCDWCGYYATKLRWKK